MEYRLRNIPVENHRKFKALAATQGLTVNELFLNLIDSYVKENIHPLGPAAAHPWWDLTDAEREEVSQRIGAGEVEASAEQEKDFFFLRLASGRTVQGVYSWGDTDPVQWALFIFKPKDTFTDHQKKLMDRYKSWGLSENIKPYEGGAE